MGFLASVYSLVCCYCHEKDLQCPAMSRTAITGSRVLLEDGETRQDRLKASNAFLKKRVRVNKLSKKLSQHECGEQPTVYLRKTREMIHSFHYGCQLLPFSLIYPLFPADQWTADRLLCNSNSLHTLVLVLFVNLEGSAQNNLFITSRPHYT